MTIAVAVGIPIPVPAAPAPTAVIMRGHDLDFTFGRRPFVYYQQDEDLWCWAACFQMIRQVLGFENWTQFDMAKKVFGDANCPTPSCATCNRGRDPDSAANDCGLQCQTSPVPADPAPLHQALGSSPVIAQFTFPTNTGPADHVILITDLAQDGTMTAYDPLPEVGRTVQPYGVFRTGYQINVPGFHGSGTWHQTYTYFGSYS